jgi:hypothetical protein
MVVKLKQNDRVLIALDENVGFAAARPVGQPIDFGREAARAVNQQSVRSGLVHQRERLQAARGHLVVGESGKLGSVAH